MRHSDRVSAGSFCLVESRVGGFQEILERFLRGPAACHAKAGRNAPVTQPAMLDPEGLDRAARSLGYGRGHLAIGIGQ